MRGEQSAALKFRAITLWITPACAGNRLSHTRRAGMCRDHPRLRGEQLHLIHYKSDAQGSPPLARGTERNFRGEISRTRITPACAGNSANWFCCQRCDRDHPRLRGEQGRAFAPQKITAGSPPLARGTDVPRCSFITWDRITPACAGNRLKKDLLYLVFYNIVFHFSISFS